ncbi:MAG: hypothetical protein ACYTG5_21895, partial [Planctomycetota bacterium]
EGVMRRLTSYCLLLTLSIPFCYGAMIRVRFAPLQMGEDPSNVLGLLLIYLLIAGPFFCAGLIICDAIQSARERVGSLYFFDLLGAGLGAIAVVLCMETLTVPGAIIALSVVSALSALLFALPDMPGPRALFKGLLALGLCWLLAMEALPRAREGKLDPPLAPSKELADLLAIPLKLEHSLWNPLARIDVSEAVPGRPTMGGAAPPNTPLRNIHSVFQDGSAPTFFIESKDPLVDMRFLRDFSAASGHVILEARGTQNVEEVAIGVGGGIDLLIALQYGVKQVTGVEINASTLKLLKEDFLEFSGGLAARSDVELVNAEGRHFARSSGRQFDLIQMSGVDTYTALSSGAYSLSETYLYTREGVDEFLDALRPGGVLSYSRIVFPNEPRESLRLAATALEALEGRGIENAESHIFILRGQSTALWASILVSPTPLESGVLTALREFAARNEYIVVFDPEEPRKNPFDDLLRTTPEQRPGFYANYPYQVRPSTDDEPFFFNFFKWKSLLEIGEYGGHAYSSKYPVGHLCLVLSLLQTVLLGGLFILRPLRSLPRVGMGGSTLAAFLFFAALGMGFIVVEIVLLQRYVLFLGHPTISLSTVLPTMLISAGLGSLTVRAGTDVHSRLRGLALWIPLAIVFAWLSSTYFLNALIAAGMGLRIAIAVLLLFPVGFVLGMAFPCGIRIISRDRPELVPWAWGINSFLTVFGSTAAVLLAMEFGFTSVMLAALPIYLVGILALMGGFRSAKNAVAVDQPSPG